MAAKLNKDGVEAGKLLTPQELKELMLKKRNAKPVKPKATKPTEAK